MCHKIRLNSRALVRVAKVWNLQMTLSIQNQTQVIVANEAHLPILQTSPINVKNTKIRKKKSQNKEQGFFFQSCNRPCSKISRWASTSQYSLASTTRPRHWVETSNLAEMLSSFITRQPKRAKFRSTFTQTLSCSARISFMKNLSKIQLLLQCKAKMPLWCLPNPLERNPCSCSKSLEDPLSRARPISQRWWLFNVTIPVRRSFCRSFRHYSRTKESLNLRSPSKSTSFFHRLFNRLDHLSRARLSPRLYRSLKLSFAAMRNHPYSLIILTR